jgi:hypothetical protein
MKRAILISLLAMSLIACSKKGPCDPEKVEAFFTLPKDKALGGARLLCKYPPALQSMLDGLDQASPDQRPAIAAKGVTQNILYFQRACPRAAHVFKVVAEVPAEQKTAMLVQGCGLEQQGLAKRYEMLNADLVNLMVAVMLYEWMQEKEVPQARDICRYLLGLSPN